MKYAPPKEKMLFDGYGQFAIVTFIYDNYSGLVIMPEYINKV